MRWPTAAWQRWKHDHARPIARKVSVRGPCGTTIQVDRPRHTLHLRCKKYVLTPKTGCKLEFHRREQTVHNSAQRRIPSWWAARTRLLQAALALPQAPPYTSALHPTSM